HGTPDDLVIAAIALAVGRAEEQFHGIRATRAHGLAQRQEDATATGHALAYHRRRQIAFGQYRALEHYPRGVRYGGVGTTAKAAQLPLDVIISGARIAGMRHQQTTAATD